MFADGVVPIDLALVHQHRHRSGGERLSRRADGKTGVRGYGSGLAESFDSMAFEIDDLIVLDDADDNSGGLEGFARVLDDRVNSSGIDALGGEANGEESEGEGAGRRWHWEKNSTAQARS